MGNGDHMMLTIPCSDPTVPKNNLNICIRTEPVLAGLDAMVFSDFWFHTSVYTYMFQIWEAWFCMQRFRLSISSFVQYLFFQSTVNFVFQIYFLINRIYTMLSLLSMQRLMSLLSMQRLCNSFPCNVLCHSFPCIVYVTPFQRQYKTQYCDSSEKL